MGICKKCRKISDLFCWNCQTGVCYDCVIDTEHHLHFVGTYEEWVENLETKPAVCPLSGKILTPEDNVIRFKNMQIFLLSAIDAYGKSKPPNTPLNEFTIPNTKEPMVPGPEDQTKIAKYIREKLKSFPWIGHLIESSLSMSSSKAGLANTTSTTATDKSKNLFADPIVKSEGHSDLTESGNIIIDPLSLPLGIASRKAAISKPTISTEHVQDTGTKHNPTKTQPPVRRSTFIDTDNEDDKYKRRTIEIDPFSGVGPTRSGTVAQRYKITGKRLLLFLALILTLFIVLLLSFNIEDIGGSALIFQYTSNQTNQLQILK